MGTDSGVRAEFKESVANHIPWSISRSPGTCRQPYLKPGREWSSHSATVNPTAPFPTRDGGRLLVGEIKGYYTGDPMSR